LLEELLEDYSGTVFLVSHDRTFLDNVVTQVIAAEGNGRWREYVGGYSDWERVKALDAAPAGAKAAAKTAEKPTEKPAEKAPPEPAAAVKPRKLSYKEQRELEQLPDLIAGLEEEQKSISQRLADPDLYRQHADEAQRLNRRFAEIDELLMQALEKWEQIEGGNAQ